MQDFISTEEVRELLSKYQIGKKPLAALLSWGATTILRYADGEVLPTGEYAVRLRKLYDEPREYFTLLEAHKDALTGVAYQKSKRAVLALMTRDKLACAASFLLQASNYDISPFRVSVTLYYAQAFSLALLDTPLFSEDCELTQEGIPYARMYERLRGNGGKDIPVVPGCLTEGEEELILSLYKTLLWFGPATLRELMLTERSYMKLVRSEKGGKKLRNASIALFFKKAVAAYHITSLAKIATYFAKHTRKAKSSDK